jgi:4-hydroxythreonine-4-phosphate dehydrogenase
MAEHPRILITMGDVAGIGPEIIVRAWPEISKLADITVIGDPDWLARAKRLIGSRAEIPCVTPSIPDLSQVQIGEVSAAAGRAAYEFLTDAIRRTMAGEADAIVTCPLHKEGLYAAGVPFPGHTEILAEQSGAKRYAMLLYGDGIAVAHVTLHMALRDAVMRITTEGVRDAIDLLNEIGPKLFHRRPRIAVCGLNPHASDGGLFGDEEQRIVAPAVDEARVDEIDVVGPLPADALWARAAGGEFDAVVALYHDQGHIAMKMRSGRRAVNITAGLPFVRTSVAHGTAYDIAGKGIADPTSLIEACKVAVQLTRPSSVASRN